MNNMKKDLSKEEVKKIFLSYKKNIEKSSSLKDIISLYENIIKEITSQRHVFILSVNTKESNIKVTTLDIDIPIGSEIDGILFKCYETKISHIVTHARRNSIYRQKVDNFIDAKIKDILLVPIFDNSEDKNIISIIWVATEYKSEDEFTHKDINYLEKLSINLAVKMTSLEQEDKKIEIINNNNIDDTLNILIIDNSPIITKFIEFVLKDYNTYIITTSNSIDGINKFNSKKIDILFIDNQIGGYKMVENIRKIEIEKKFDSIPIFVMTTYITNTIKENLLKVGANTVLTKPMDKQDIINAIQEFRILKKKITQLI